MTLIIWMGVDGRSPRAVGVVSIFLMTSMPSMMRPKTGCFEGVLLSNQSRYLLWTVLMKNWQLPLLG